MTEKELLEQLCDCANESYGVAAGMDVYLDFEDFDLIRRALEKQIPKKPIKKFDGNEWSILCPVCKRYPFDLYEYEWARQFCGYCGQAIDWRLYEDK